MSDQPDWVHPTAGNESRAIVSVGVGSQHARQCLHSTITHCAVHCPETWRRWYDVLPEGCPPHAIQHYAFKIYALRTAIEAGFRSVLWMDATFQPVASIEPLWKHIEQYGWYVAKQGNSVLGEWASDDALRIYGIDRDKAMAIPLVYSGLVGFKTENEIAKRIWQRWVELQKRGAWNGPHQNVTGGVVLPWGMKWSGHCSRDPRCAGHRHDEAALSFILHEMGFQPVAADFDGLGIGRQVPDYDVVKMREWILEAQERCGMMAPEGGMKLCR